jgi:hypothetical protein
MAPWRNRRSMNSSASSYWCWIGERARRDTRNFGDASFAAAKGRDLDDAQFGPPLTEEPDVAEVASLTADAPLRGQTLRPRINNMIFRQRPKNAECHSLLDSVRADD